MNGTDLLNEISRRIAKEQGTKTISDATLAKEIGVTQPNLALWRGKELTPRQVVNLMERLKKQSAKHTVARALNPIVEFFDISAVESKQGNRWELFSAYKDGYGRDKHPYLAGLQERLNSTHGIYVFHDSRGRAIYVGKARYQTLWAEMNLAFNRDRGSVQSIKRVDHPNNRVIYKESDGKRAIKKHPVALHEIASYVSAYEIADNLVGKLEALIVRAFANDLLNVRMERFSPD